MRYGIQIVGRDSTEMVDAIVEAERLGFDAAWLTSGWVAPDPFPILAAAARETKRILLGTSIVPMLSRHPLTTAQATIVVQELSEGRFRLGIGTTTRQVAERILGVPWPRPLAALREYVAILRELLETGKVAFTGESYSARGRLSRPCPTPLFVAALGERAYENAGAIADGVISWMAPRTYLEQVARPALDRGASAEPGRRCGLIAHVPATDSADPSAIAAALARQLGGYARVPEYQAMFAAAGAPIGDDGTYPQRLVDDLVLPADGPGIANAIAQLERAGADEVLLSVLDTGSGIHESTAHIARLILP